MPIICCLFALLFAGTALAAHSKSEGYVVFFSEDTAVGRVGPALGDQKTTVMTKLGWDSSHTVEKAVSLRW